MKSVLLSLMILAAPAFPAAAQDWALGGYDAVAYERSGRPVPGRSEIVTMWKGKLWHFASEENRARFESDPRIFAPGFNGFCPVSLSEGKRVQGDPRHFVIIGKRLYVVRSAAAERQFMQAPREILMKAKQSWARLR
ncbi:YHS domain-containing (seleno)protein [Paracoccus salsus]|uniref:YHS domain-containing (seleno)protein n=1 Tax=Paracoccus salsus TaxID=2911061 RepID=UPI001F227A73|nr:YHS domain-containing (seleno)protein [Paracoccus salsus]MCF3972561.1 hypothetical protein [Paracoccus salsus]